MNTTPERKADAASTAGWSEERIALNDGLFRNANESIEGVAENLETDADINIPFLCECADPGCTSIIRLSLAAYEHIREKSTHFLNAGAAHVVESFDDYDIVAKTGRAGEVAELIDERRAR